MSAIKSRLIRSPRLIRFATRKSLNTVHGFTPALRARLPSSACNVAVEPGAAKIAKQGSWKNPVGENFEATVGPHGLSGVPEGTTLGRPVLGENWKLSGLPVRMLNGRPEAISTIGATVQLLKNLLAKLSPESLPLW